MRMCLFSQEDIVRPQGGIGTYVRNISIALAARGHDVHVIARRRAGEPAFEQVEGVHLHRVAAPGPPVLYSPLYFRQAARLFRALSAEAPFDVVHGNLPLMSSWGVSAGLPPVVETVHCTVREELRALSHTALSQLNFNEVLTRALTPVLYQRERLLLERARRVIAVSGGLKRELVEQEGFADERVEVIPNGIDYRHFAGAGPEAGATLRRALGIDPRERVILYLGRLVERKRAIDLVRALPAVRRSVPDARLVIVGRRNANAARIARETVRLGVAAYVTQIDHVAYRDVPAYYAMADVYALPSAYEGFPFTVIEAMAAGTPVVASHIRGIDEQVTPLETGLLHPVGDVAAIAEQLTRALCDRPLAARMAAAAQRMVAARFTWDVIGARTEEVFLRAAA
ncbi:MAG TPA: glycosyltransferase family 4 protein [Roseiflexaceae bacterium]|nr:glycosyltransferase family 4 protein [Roseiflexaceae bacterium]